MSADQTVYLPYYVMLTDPVRVSELQGNTSGGIIGAPIKAPDQAVIDYSAPILQEGQPFAAPCIKSPWFGKGFPTNVSTFERSSGGLWGLPGFVSSLFGAGRTTTRYYWRANFVYVPPNEPVVGTATISPPFWLDGFELPESGENSNASGLDVFNRDASRRVHGLGLGLRSNSFTRTHNPVENVGGTAPGNSWERFYIRPRAYPNGAAEFWRCTSNSGGSGMGLAMTPSGQLAVSQIDDPGNRTLLGTSAALPLNTWKRIDVLTRWGTNASDPQVKTFVLYINGVVALNLSTSLGTSIGGRRHGTSTMGVSGSNTLGLDVDDWKCAAEGISDGQDFQFGSAIVRVPVKSITTQTGFVGDGLRVLQQWPNLITSMGASAELLIAALGAGSIVEAVMDAGQYVDALEGSIGCTALLASILDNGVTLNSTLQILTGAFTDPNKQLAAAGSTAWRFAFAPIAAGQTVAKQTVAPCSIKYTKLTDGAEHLYAMHLVAECLGVFGDEDIPDTMTDKPEPPITHLGPHNAVYPFSPWARQAQPTTQPVFVKGGTYVGNGTGQDLLFPYPVHWFIARPASGDVGGTFWTSALLSAHQGIREYPVGHDGFADQDLSFDPTAAYGVDQMGLPARPALLVDAIALANTVAYGFDKHLNNGYWDALWGTDPGYAWLRMLGQGAGGDDVARYGPYAVPPSPWNQQEMQFRYRISGNDAQSNANGVTYQYVAVCDPAARFVYNGCLDHPRGATGTKVTNLRKTNFKPDGGFFLQEIISFTNFSRLWWKGPGHASASISVLDAAETANALAMAIGQITTQSAFHSTSFCQVMHSLWRVDDGTNHKGKVCQITSYVGDGNATRTIALPISTGTRPLFAMIVPHNAAAWCRDFNHTGTNSQNMGTRASGTTSIVGGGVDSLTVGTTLNTNAIVYDVFVIMGGTTAGNGGFSPPGTFTPVPPEALAIDPSQGSVDGGTDVTITGGSFLAGTTVTIGGVNAPVQSITVDAIRAVTGAHAAGLVDVIITPPDGSANGEILNGYTYIEETSGETLAITPTQGSVNGGTTVTITGSGFLPTSTVTIGGVPLTGLIITDTTIVGVTGAHAAGIVDVVVTVDGVTVRGTIVNGYTYVPQGDVVNPPAPTGPMPGFTDDVAAACLPDTLRICNVALARLGLSEQITDLVAETTAHALQVRLVYTDAVQVTLRDFPWPFATRIVQLALVQAAPNSEWAYVYRQPTDCLFERRIVVPRTASVDPTPPGFELGSDDTGGLIYTNEASAVLEYTARPKCPHTRSEPLFRDAVAWKLAEMMAPALTRMTQKELECKQAYEAALERARQVLRPGKPGPVPTAPTIDTAAAAQAANTAVVNRALVRIGAGTIRNLTTDQTREAQAARLIFEEELQSTLRDFPWPFATRYAPLTLVGGTSSVAVNSDWQYSYRLPASMLFARRLVNSYKRAYDEHPPAFRLSSDATGGLLFTDETSAMLEYTIRVDGAVAASDPLFRDALAWRLAASLAPSLAQKTPEDAEQVGRGPDDPKQRPKERPATGVQLRTRVADIAWQMYQRALATARVAAANESQRTRTLNDADWIAGR